MKQDQPALDAVHHFDRRVPPTKPNVSFTSTSTRNTIDLTRIRQRPAHAREIVGCWIIDHAVPGKWRS